MTEKSTTFSSREMEVLALAWQCMDTQPKIDMHKLAALTGYTHGSASVTFGNIKRKIKLLGEALAEEGVKKNKGSAGAKTAGLAGRKRCAGATSGGGNGGGGDGKGMSRKKMKKSSTPATGDVGAGAGAEDDDDDDDDDDDEELNLSFASSLPKREHKVDVKLETKPTARVRVKKEGRSGGDGGGDGGMLGGDEDDVVLLQEKKKKEEKYTGFLEGIEEFAG